MLMPPLKLLLAHVFYASTSYLSKKIFVTVFFNIFPRFHNVSTFPKYIQYFATIFDFFQYTLSFYSFCNHVLCYQHFSASSAFFIFQNFHFFLTKFNFLTYLTSFKFLNLSKLFGFSIFCHTFFTF